MCALARTAGALGAKLTGAGGGGSVVALVSGNAAAERVLAAWGVEGFWGFSTRVAGFEVPAIAAAETSP
jgi:mevalonate kinase